VAFDTRPRIASRDDTRQQAALLGFGIATIRYPELLEHDSKLIYLKPCLLPENPSDVRAYANAHVSFPHEATLDQFFTESQFESYRALGEFQAERLCGGLACDGLEELFRLAVETDQTARRPRRA
jgi:hypothetical protein